MDKFLRLVNQVMAERSDLTIVEIARRAHISRPYLYRILNGTSQPSLQVVEKIAKALGLEVKILRKRC